MRNTGGGAFDRGERNVYFLATNPDDAREVCSLYNHVLIAVNELRTDGHLEVLESVLSTGCKVFLDSGIFWMTNEHARKNGITMDQALGLPPDKIDGFDWLWGRYVEIVRRFESRLWGYIELDQGGREQKIKTRQRLHDLGLNPIPVYHPLLDGWEYFDQLAEGYDRICVGNVVQAKAYARKRLLATTWSRMQAYPHLWVHLLGITPHWTLNSFPTHSVDSSTWLSVVRWDGLNERCALKSIGRLPKNYQYLLGDKVGWMKAKRQGALAEVAHARNWQGLLASYEGRGYKVHP